MKRLMSLIKVCNGPVVSLEFVESLPYFGGHKAAVATECVASHACNDF